MRHRSAFRKLGRTPAHRRALFRNLATNLVIHERIETTVSKAKELRRVVDKLITLGKKDSLHARRQALKYLQPVNRKAEGNALKTTAMHKLFTELAPRFKNREGGYTRVIRGRRAPIGKRLDGRRSGDLAEMAIIEFVTEEVAKKAKKKRRTSRKVTAKKEAVVPASAAPEEPITAGEVQSEEAETKEAAPKKKTAAKTKTTAEKNTTTKKKDEE